MLYTLWGLKLQWPFASLKQHLRWVYLCPSSARLYPLYRHNFLPDSSPKIQLHAAFWGLPVPHVVIPIFPKPISCTHINNTILFFFSCLPTLVCLFITPLFVFFAHLPSSRQQFPADCECLRVVDRFVHFAAALGAEAEAHEVEDEDTWQRLDLHRLAGTHHLRLITPRRKKQRAGA